MHPGFQGLHEGLLTSPVDKALYPFVELDQERVGLIRPGIERIRLQDPEELAAEPVGKLRPVFALESKSIEDADARLLIRPCFKGKSRRLYILVMPETVLSRLSAALAGRYAIERELGQGGMATVYWPTTSATAAKWRSRSCGPSLPQ
jgi:hypothetical protein